MHALSPADPPPPLTLSLVQVTKVLVRNLNKIIDVNWYPVEEAQKSNVRHRPMGIGVQGLADTFIKVSGDSLLLSCSICAYGPDRSW